MPLPKLTKVKLLGILGKKFTRELDLDITSPTEAIKALSVLFPEFPEFLNKSSEEGIEYRVLSMKDKTYQEIQEEDLMMSINGDILIIAPTYVYSGGSPIFRTILGVGLIGAAFMTGGVSLLGMSISSTSMGLMGAALVLGGVSQMLSPNPVKDKAKEEKENRSLAALNNTATQGRAIPLIYGQVMHESLIPISQSVTNEILVGDAVEAITRPEHTRVTQARLAYVVKPVHNYSYYDHPRLRTPLGVSYLTNSDPFIGCAVAKEPFNTLAVEVRFTTTPEGLSMAAKYPIQRVLIHSGMEGFVGANRVDIYAGNSSTGQVAMGAYYLQPGYTDLNFSGIPIYKQAFHVYTFYFFNNNASIPYIAVGELEIYGSIGLANSINYVLG